MGRISYFALSTSLLIISLTLHNVSGYSSGADSSVCDTMIPGHGATPQSSESPYKIILSSNAVKGLQSINITLTSKNGNDIFKGFLIQVRKPGSSTPTGKFSKIAGDSDAQPLECLKLEDSAMTHTKSTEKRSVTVTWTAPNEENGDYQVYYTAVGPDGGTYWTAVPHAEKVAVTKDLDAKVSAPKPQAFSANLLERLRKIYDGCGDTKGCFGMPGSCISDFDATSDEPKICDNLVTWKKAGEKNEFQMAGRAKSGSGAYIAVGFSDDASMGQDSVVGCAFVGSDPVRARRYFNPSDYNEKHSNPNLGLTAKEGDIEDGIITCEFDQTNHEDKNIAIDFDNNKYHYLLSRASLGDINGALTRHAGEDRIPSPDAYHITDTLSVGASSKTWLIQLHGGVMVIAWMLCASTGMFTARYYKQTHTDVMPFGKAFWFALHTFCMSSTVFLTICGSIFIIIYKKGIVLRDVHPILGVIVIGLALLQVLIALFRPHPGTPKRPIFNWFHWGVGTSAQIVSIACIFMAWELDLANLKRFGDENLWNWLMMALVLFHFLMHIVMSIHTLWVDKQMDSSKNKKRGVYPGPMKPNGLSSEAPGTSFRTFMLALYFLVMLAGAIALVCLVFWPKNKTEEEVTS